MGVRAGGNHTLRNRAQKFRSCLIARDVIAGTGSSPPQHAATGIAYYRLGAGLAAVYTEKDLTGMRQCPQNTPKSENGFEMLYFRGAEHLIDIEQDLHRALHLGDP